MGEGRPSSRRVVCIGRWPTRCWLCGRRLIALGVALVASVGHFNPASLIFAALLLLSSKEEPASRKGKSQHWMLHPRTTRFVWAVLVCDLLLLPSVVFLVVACREMKSLLTEYVTRSQYGFGTYLQQYDGVPTPGHMCLKSVEPS